MKSPPLDGLRERRTFRRLTQTHMAEVLGVNQSHYRQFENGMTRLDIHRAKKLADYFGCAIEDLL
jgi:transcriptional regulator with XRE-family HTH domain